MKGHSRAMLFCSAVLVSGLLCGMTAQGANTNELEQIRKKDLALEGKIAAIDTKAGMVTIQHKEKGAFTFSVPKTALLFVITKKGHAALTDFKVGETVVAEYRQSGSALVCDSMWQPGSNPVEQEAVAERKERQTK